MEKIDFKKQFKYLYSHSVKRVEIVEVPPMNFQGGYGRSNIAYRAVIRGGTNH
jgi:hypothetical protein